MRLSNDTDNFGTQYNKDKHTPIGVVFEGEINHKDPTGEIVYTDNFILEQVK